MGPSDVSARAATAHTLVAYGIGQRPTPTLMPYHTTVDTTELLKAAMDAVRAAGVPKELQGAALELAVADLRAHGTRVKAGGGAPPTKREAPGSAGTRPRKTAATAPRHDSATEEGVLSHIPADASFFKAIEKETGVSTTDLSDIFHVDDGRLELKVPSKDLGTNKRAQTQTVTALLGGAIFAGTSQRKLPFSEINRVCDAKHCFDSSNAASSIKGTPGFSAVGSGRAQALVTKSGWHDEFARAARRALRKPEPTA